MLILFLSFSGKAKGTLKLGRKKTNSYAKRKAKSKAISRYHGAVLGGKFRPYQFITGNINALNYYGDLGPLAKATSTDIFWTRPGMGVNFGYKMNPNLAFRDVSLITEG